MGEIVEFKKKSTLTEEEAIKLAKEHDQMSAIESAKKLAEMPLDDMVKVLSHVMSKLF